MDSRPEAQVSELPLVDEGEHRLAPYGRWCPYCGANLSGVPVEREHTEDAVFALAGKRLKVVLAVLFVVIWLAVSIYDWFDDPATVLLPGWYSALGAIMLFYLLGFSPIGLLREKVMIEHHHAPVPGDPQPLSGPKGRRRSQGGGGGGFVNVNDRLFAPLQSLDPNNILQGGYGWLDKTDGGMTYHPGLDLNAGGSCNADEGLAVVAPLAGVVRAVLYWNGSTPGEGNHVWVELDDPCCPGPTWWHTDHLQGVYAGVGQRLAPGQAVGTCGRTGGWDCAHAHTELLTGTPRDGWWQWPYGWSRAQVEAAYWQPNAWWNAATTLVLAEGSQPIPPETVKAMTDWQLINWVLATLYDWAGLGHEFNHDGGIQKCWVEALRAGHYPGRPRTGDRAFGDPVEGWWAEFENGLLIYKADGEMSWTG